MNFRTHRNWSQQSFWPHDSSSQAMGNGCAHKAPQGTSASLLEASSEQPDWEDLPAERWPGPDAVTLSTDCQLSPTQPMTRRVKGSPTTPGQPVQVKSPPPNVTGGTAQNSHFHRAPALRTISRHILTNSWSQEGCTNSLVKPLSNQAIPFCHRYAAWQTSTENKQICEQPDAWYQQAPSHFHHYTPSPGSSTKPN